MNQNIWVTFFLKLHSGFKTKWKLSFRKMYMIGYQTKVWLIIQDSQQILKLESLKNVH